MSDKSSLKFYIDTEKCTECGECAEDCPTLIIDSSKGVPEIKAGKEHLCIRCQHCLAICPTGALSIHGKHPGDSFEANSNIPSAEEMQRLIKTRRSVRRFKKDILEQELIDDLLQTAAYSPSGHNKNEVLFTISYTPEEMNKLSSMVYEGIRKAKENGKISGDDRIYNSFLHLWDTKDIDVLFRKAPHIIIASAPASNSNGLVDSIISLSYFELYANTHGISTLWDGLAKFVFDKFAPDLKTRLGIPEDHKIGYLMVFGYPATKYSRAVQSDALNINRIII